MNTLYQEAPFLYFSSTDDGILLEVNDTLSRYLQYSRNELIGQKAEIIFTMPTRIFQQTHFFPLLRMQGHAEEIYITLQTKEKEPVPVLINANRNMINGEGISVYAGIVVHNRKKFEDELVAAKKAAEKALSENTALLEAKRELQKHTELLDEQMNLTKKQNEELRQFNHVVTHELQEPLRKLLVFTNMLLEKENEDASKKTTHKIKAVSEQMRTIISGLQQYVWLIETPVKKTPIDLKALLVEINSELQKDQPSFDISLSKEDLPVIEADKEQLRFLMQEIFTNAIRFRKEGEAVKINVTATEVQVNKFRSVAGKYQYTSFQKIQVKDNGIGFDAAYKEQAFMLFKRLHSVSGRGVGLSLCRKIAENHEGSIQIDSRSGEGTTVTILLPYRDKNTSSTEYTDEQKILSGNEG